MNNLREITYGLSLLVIVGCQLNMEIVGAGKITSSSGDFNCDESSCSYTVPENGLQETFTAEPAPGYEFAGWGGVCGNMSAATCEISIAAEFTSFGADLDLSARFSEASDPGNGTAATLQALEALANGSYGLVGANAYVKAGGREHKFQLQFDDVYGLPLANCNLYQSSDNYWTVLADFSRTIPRSEDDYFSFWTPTGFDESNPTGAGVQLGVFEYGSGREWSAVPGGNSFLQCRQQGFGVSCTIAWFGLVNENSAPEEKKVGLVNMHCYFDRFSVALNQCPEPGCDDGNPCTLDYCSAGACFHESLPREFVEPDDPNWRDMGEAWAAAVYQCDLDGAPGICRDGTCQEDPCGGACSNTFSYHPLSNECEVDFCLASANPPGCLDRTITNCNN